MNDNLIWDAWLIGMTIYVVYEQKGTLYLKQEIRNIV